MTESAKLLELQRRQLPTDRPKVLVVDDDASTRLMAREVLEPAGFIVEEAEGGRHGLLLIESFRPDVVLLDIVMPEMDGFATLKSLRKRSGGSDCPVVMITGLHDPGAVEMAYELGATDFVTKPVNWGLLRHRLAYVLRSSMKGGACDRDTLENALQLAGVGVWRWDPETNRLDASSQFLSVLGLTRRPPFDPKFALALIQRDDRPRVLDALGQSLSGKGTRDLETSFRVETRGRPERLVRIRAQTVQGDGAAVALTGILEDITEPRSLERKLNDVRDSAQRLQHLIKDLLSPSSSTRAEETHNGLRLMSPGPVGEERHGRGTDDQQTKTRGDPRDSASR